MPPIDAAVVYGVAAAGKGALKRRMELECRRPLEQLLVEGDELLRSYRGFARLGELRLLRPHDGILVGVGVLRVSEDALEVVGNVAIHRLHLLLGDDALSHEPRAPNFPRRWMRLDQVV